MEQMELIRFLLRMACMYGGVKDRKVLRSELMRLSGEAIIEGWMAGQITLEQAAKELNVTHRRAWELRRLHRDGVRPRLLRKVIQEAGWIINEKGKIDEKELVSLLLARFKTNGVRKDEEEAA